MLGPARWGQEALLFAPALEGWAPPGLEEAPGLTVFFPPLCAGPAVSGAPLVGPPWPVAGSLKGSLVSAGLLSCPRDQHQPRGYLAGPGYSRVATAAGEPAAHHAGPGHQRPLCSHLSRPHDAPRDSVDKPSGKPHAPGRYLHSPGGAQDPIGHCPECILGPCASDPH